MTLAEFLRTDDTARGLLAAIRARPADDLPRLMLADHVEEQFGGEWPAFVRASCEYAVWEFDYWGHEAPPGRSAEDVHIAMRCDCHGCQLRRRLRPMTPRRDEWFADLTRAFDGPIQNPRGFVEGIKCTAEQWVKHGDAVLAHPLVVAPEVTLTTRPEYDEFGGDNEGDKPHLYLYALGDTAPADDDPRVVWCERQIDDTGIVRELLSRRWPAVSKWTLPQWTPAALPGPVAWGQPPDFREIVDQQTAAIARGLGIPPELAGR